MSEQAIGLKEDTKNDKGMGKVIILFLSFFIIHKHTKSMWESHTVGVGGTEASISSHWI